MQILHPFLGSLQQYAEPISDPGRYRPDNCPQCKAPQPLVGHGFYSRTLVDGTFEGVSRVRRYLCPSCQRTVCLLPRFALPYLRFSVSVIALFLMDRLLEGRTLVAAAVAAAQPHMPYQSGQFWVRGAGRQDHSHANGQFRDQSFAYVAVLRLDRRASVHVFPTAAAPVGLAALSRSPRSSRHARLDRITPEIENTQHLSSFPTSSRIDSRVRREKVWRAKPRKLPCSAMG